VFVSHLQVSGSLTTEVNRSLHSSLGIIHYKGASVGTYECMYVYISFTHFVLHA